VVVVLPVFAGVMSVVITMFTVAGASNGGDDGGGGGGVCCSDGGDYPHSSSPDCR
jgi:hypothetical protein